MLNQPGRMQDIELMHLRYALESAVLALGAIDSNSLDERDHNWQEAFCYLNDLKNHLEAIANIPRKVLFFLFMFSCYRRYPFGEKYPRPFGFSFCINCRSFYIFLLVY